MNNLPRIKLFGRFLLCEPNPKKDASFFSHRNSKDVSSSNGRFSFRLGRYREFGFLRSCWNNTRFKVETYKINEAVLPHQVLQDFRNYFRRVSSTHKECPAFIFVNFRFSSQHHSFSTRIARLAFDATCVRVHQLCWFGHLRARAVMLFRPKDPRDFGLDKLHRRKVCPRYHESM